MIAISICNGEGSRLLVHVAAPDGVTVTDQAAIVCACGRDVASVECWPERRNIAGRALNCAVIVADTAAVVPRELPEGSS